MQVWTIASARATIGGPSFDSRTPWSAASFQRMTALRPRASIAPAGRRVAAPASGGARSAAPHAPVHSRKRRLEISESAEFIALRLALGRSDPSRLSSAAQPTAGSPLVRGIPPKESSADRDLSDQDPLGRE